jgi:predicted CDP-diglyceride synthetase/phosphatidate cytidylyltransferase
MIGLVSGSITFKRCAASQCRCYYSELTIAQRLNAAEAAQRIRLVHDLFAVLRLMAPFMAIVRLLIASVYAGATIAGIHAVAAITFTLLMTVLHVGAIAWPIG